MLNMRPKFVFKSFDSPINTAPDTSHTVANQHACRIVRTPDPTLVPKEFATSFAPMPKANTKAMIKPTTTIQRTAAVKGSIIVTVNSLNSKRTFFSSWFPLCFFFGLGRENLENLEDFMGKVFFFLQNYNLRKSHSLFRFKKN